MTEDEERFDPQGPVIRVMAPAASLVCRVLSTRCPVSAAWTAMLAVSLSRISPTMMTSGSCRRMERRPLAKVMPALRLSCTWRILSMRYSTGSSTVMMLMSGWLIRFRIEYRLVLLPLPVGPVLRIMPYGLVMMPSIFCRSLSFIPSSSSE